MKSAKTIIRIVVIMVFLYPLNSVFGSEPLPSAHSLRIGEGFENPIGFYDARPGFSWKLPVCKEVKAQSAYEIVAASEATLLPNNPDLWSTQKVKSDRSVWITYAGKPLNSRQRIYWQVRYWDQAGNVSSWSEVAHFEMGLLNNDYWEARWIGDPFDNAPDTTKFGTKIYPAQYIRREVGFDSEVISARLHITAKGVFEAQINGQKVGEAVMAPGYTPYLKRIETLTYDVTGMLDKGRNAIGIIVAPGWNTTRIGWSKSQYIEKQPPKMICQLEVTLNNGLKKMICSDGMWKSTNRGPIRSSEIYDGEIYDQALEFDGWSRAGFDDTMWKNVVVESVDASVALQPKRHHQVKVKHELPAQKITKSGMGIIFDVGQNMVGVPKVKAPMKKGDTLIIRFAEMLQDNGELYTESYRSAHSTDYYIASKDGWIEYIPKFTFHGFRYVELTGFASGSTPGNDWVTGLVQYSDFNKNGDFSSSDAQLNQLQRNIEWGLRGNFFDIPTDCPQRDERMGWTGDAQIFAPTSYFLADVHSFWTSWLQSVREEQASDGRIPIVVPNVAKDRVSPGWGDAIAIIPWETYIRTGEVKVLEENYEAMKRWVDFYLAHQKGEIIELKGFGDWLQPFSSLGNFGETPLDMIATAFCAYSMRLTMQAAEVLGYKADHEELGRTYRKLRSAFESHFFDAAGKIVVSETQTGYLMALGFDLLTDPLIRKGAEQNLVGLIEKADNHLRTGFLGTPLLAPVLDQIGRADLMYTILFQESYPSWFYSINQGATTMWERWNSYSRDKGFGDAGMNSFNHYAYGAIGQWMYERIAGISPLLPGYKKIRIAPYPDNRLTFAKGEYESPYGRIVSQWSSDEGRFTLHAVVPPNSVALIVIRKSTLKSTVINGEKLKKHKSVKIIEQGADYFSFEVPAGTYDIRSDN
ncbi:MAG: glycoside hydrolase family 78 protein [Bacteroidales bacterium]|jgi:alpha-L-rhamnosidase|nr:glycoside hydrolase family 78 protein [Bacteroidales bacterium]